MLRRISARYSRGLAAAVVAVVALIMAANFGPVRTATPQAPAPPPAASTVHGVR
ncbi:MULTISPECIES: hypothetical protein [unclassified Streptomyces]|uniref:hypothetical protein n=1 Tax=unclassified Streptomyces TaxID=2593676 RepID=UPI0033BDE00C